MKHKSMSQKGTPPITVDKSFFHSYIESYKTPPMEPYPLQLEFLHKEPEFRRLVEDIYRVHLFCDSQEPVGGEFHELRQEFSSIASCLITGIAMGIDYSLSYLESQQTPKQLPKENKKPEDN